jgi:hypothetical protein
MRDMTTDGSFVMERCRRFRMPTRLAALSSPMIMGMARSP